MLKWRGWKSLFSAGLNFCSDAEEPLLSAKEVCALEGDHAMLDSLLDQVSIMIDGHDLESAEDKALQALAFAQEKFSTDDCRLGYCYNSLGVVALQAERFDDCERYLEQALEIQVQAFGNEHAEVAAVVQNLAVCRDLAGRMVAAEESYSELLRLQKTLLGNRHPGLAGIYERLAALNENFERYNVAADHLQNLLAIIAKGVGPESEKLADLSIKLAENLFKGEDYYNAEGHFKYALNLCHKQYGERSAQSAKLLEQLSHVYRHLQMFDAAVDCGEKVIILNRELVGEQHPHFCKSLFLQARLYADAQKEQLAETAFFSLVETLECLPEPSYEELSEMWLDTGDFFLRHKNVQAAEHAYQELCTLAEETLEANYAAQAICLQRLGHVAFVRRKFAEAEELYLKALNRIVRAGKIDQEECARIYNSLAMTALYAGDSQGAINFCYQASALLKVKDGERLGLWGHNYDLLSRAYAQLTDSDKAEQYFYQAMALYERVYGGQHDKTFRLKLRLAEFYTERNQHENAAKSYSYALEGLGEECDFARDEVKWAAVQLINLYRRQGKHDKAATLEGRVWTQASPLLAAAC